MGWSNYLINEKYKIAFEIGKINYSDVDEEVVEPMDELLEYINKNDDEIRKIEVMNYLFKKLEFIDTSRELLVSLIIGVYGMSWVIVSESEVPEHFIKIYL